MCKEIKMIVERIEMQKTGEGSIPPYQNLIPTSCQVLKRYCDIRKTYLGCWIWSSKQRPCGLHLHEVCSVANHEGSTPLLSQLVQSSKVNTEGAKGVSPPVHQHVVLALDKTGMKEERMQGEENIILEKFIW